MNDNSRNRIDIKGGKRAGGVGDHRRDFQTDFWREKEMIECPLQLMPQKWNNPIIDKPLWLSEPPELHFLCKTQAITLSDIMFRDRFGVVWFCPRGFPFDGMSYPFFLRWAGWDRFDKRTRRTATMHDLRYTLHDYVEHWDYFDNQKDADRGLLDGLRLEFPSRAVTCYIGVRFGGFAVYEHISYEFLMEKWFKAVADQKLDDYIKEVANMKHTT
jgi:hypothetical protein